MGEDPVKNLFYYSRLRNSDLLVIDGSVFIEANFNKKEYKQLKQKRCAVEEIENYINHIHLSLISDDYKTQKEMGFELKTIWEDEARERNVSIKVKLLDNGECVDMYLNSDRNNHK